MYFFVRFTGIVLLILGILLMLFGIGTMIYGLVQTAALVDLINNYLLVSLNSRFDPNLDANVLVRNFTTLLGLASFLGGMLTSAFGQLMLVFADIASNTRETNALLRGLRRVE